MDELLNAEGLMDAGSLKLEDSLRLAQANIWRKIEWLRSVAEQHRKAAEHLDGEASRLVKEANEHPYQEEDED